MKFKKTTSYVIVIMIVIMCGVVNVKATEKSDQANIVFEEQLNKMFESDENGDYKYTYQILDSSKIEGKLKETYDKMLDSLVTNGTYQSILVNNENSLTRFAYETSIIDDSYDGKVMGRLNIDECTLKDYSDKKVYNCKVSYAYSVSTGIDKIPDGMSCSSGYTNCSTNCSNGYEYCLAEGYETVKKNLAIELIKNEPDQNIINQIYKYYEKYPNRITAEIRDLSYINLVASMDFPKGNMNLYKFENLAAFVDGAYSNFPDGSLELKSCTTGAAAPTEIEGGVSGALAFIHNNILYDISYTYPAAGAIQLYIQNVFYVPSGTAKENYAKEVMKRISDYLNDDSYTVEVVNTNNKYTEVFHPEDMLGISSSKIITEASNKDLYQLTISNLTKTYTTKILIIEGDEENMKLPEVNYKNYKSNIMIRSNSSDVPLDSMLEVEKIELGQRHDNIKTALGNKEFVAYNLILESSIKGRIENIVNGEIHVYIPLPSGYDEKSSSIYYVSDTNTITKHEIIEYITIDGIRYVHFVTNHFSDYAIVNENVNVIKNPKTGDTTNMYFIGVIGVLLFGVLLYKRKKILNII